MKRKPKVLMLASVASMIDQFNLPNIRLLLNMGYEVHVACNFREGNTCDKKRVRTLIKILRGMQVFLHQWDCPRAVCPVKNGFLAYRQLLGLMGRVRFAWIHCHSPVGGALARLAAHRNGIPVLYTAHGFHFYKGAPIKNWLLYYPVEKLLSLWTDMLVTVNREDYRLAKRHLYAKQVCWIPGIGVDSSRFQALGDADRARIRERICKKYQIAQDAVCLLSVGELSRRKNHQVVLQAVWILRQRGQKVCYLICGQGVCGEKLKQQAATLGITDSIRMTGYVQAVEELYQAADLFVFPSLQEGLPAALMEAMAAGLACVVSDIRGNRELLKLTFSPTDARQLADLLEFMIQNPKLRLRYGRYNQMKIKSYELAVVQRKMLDIYHTMQIKYEKKVQKEAADNPKQDQPYAPADSADNHAACCVRVLMAVYNGAKYLRQQLDSILCQQGVTVSLLIRDDGSCDGSMEILHEYACRYPNLSVYTGRHKGAAGSFFDLMQRTDTDSAYYAFADQDDVWHPAKLRRAVSLLQKEDASLPLLYGADVLCATADLKRRWKSQQRIRRAVSFGNALMENRCKGCTEVFNRKLLTLVREHPPGDGTMHDWWMYLTAARFGTVLYDTRTYILYRQHENNTIGAQDSLSARWFRRIRHARQKKHLLTSQAAKFCSICQEQAAAGSIQHTDTEADEILHILCSIGKTPGSRLRILCDRRLYRQSLLDGIVCRILLAVGYL